MSSRKLRFTADVQVTWNVERSLYVILLAVLWLTG